MDTNQKIIKIAIIGGGFGGVYALKHLNKLFKQNPNVKITLVNDQNYFLFTPLIHEVATGSIQPENAIEPLREICRHEQNDFYFGEAKEISLVQKTIKIDGGKIGYDYLVISAGARTNFFSVPGAKDRALGLKTLAEAIALKNHFLEMFEAAARTSDKDELNRLLRFVVVGGGPTGVEIAAEMADFFFGTLAERYKKYRFTEKIKIILLQRSGELIPQFPAKLRQKAYEILTKKGIEVRLNTKVENIEEYFIQLENGKKIETGTIVWVPGVCPNEPAFDQPPQKAPDGKLFINQNLQLTNYPEVFALGDIAHCSSSNPPLPALAQVAVKQARQVAENIFLLTRGKAPRPFFYKHAGNLLSLGRGQAVGEIKGVYISGWFAWWLWRTVYLFKMISWRKKIRVAFDWTINLFLPRDISRIKF